MLLAGGLLRGPDPPSPVGPCSLLTCHDELCLRREVLVVRERGCKGDGGGVVAVWQVTVRTDDDAGRGAAALKVIVNAAAVHAHGEEACLAGGRLPKAEARDVSCKWGEI